MGEITVRSLVMTWQGCLSYLGYGYFHKMALASG